MPVKQVDHELLFQASWVRRINAEQHFFLAESLLVMSHNIVCRAEFHNYERR